MPQESRAEKRADRKAQRDAERARLKAEEQAQDAISYDDAMAALKAHQFVMEADQVMFRNGRSAFVNSNTNFVLVNQGRGTVQVAFNTAYPGPNGIGGVTVDGTVSGAPDDYRQTGQRELQLQHPGYRHFRPDIPYADQWQEQRNCNHQPELQLQHHDF